MKLSLLKVIDQDFRKPGEDGAIDLMIKNEEDEVLGIFWEPTGLPKVAEAQRKIITAFNSHDDLVAALEICLLQMALEDMLLPNNAELGSAMQIAHTALAKAKAVQ